MHRSIIVPALFFCSCSYENPCGYEVGEGVAVLEGLSFTADYPDDGIDIGFKGRACVEPDAGWSGYLMYFQRVEQEDDAPVYLTAAVWEIDSTTVDTQCTDCAFAFETDLATSLARVGDDGWNETDFILKGIGLGSLDDELPLIHYNQDGQGYSSVSILGEYTLDGEMSDEGDYYDYTFDQYGLYD